MEPLQMNMVSDTAVRVIFGTVISMETHKNIRSFCRELEKHPQKGIQEWVPSYTAVTIFYDPFLLSFDSLEAYIMNVCDSIEHHNLPDSMQVTIPVCYEEAFGPDLNQVAVHNQLTPEEVIELHTEPEYLIHMMGFLPGFPYLGGMNEKIAAPRLDAPRMKVPAGSVGIAGSQTGVYPLESPGGWNIIGRTPKKLFLPQETDPVLLEAGMRIKFMPVTTDEFLEMEEKEASC
ncbi:5-oxoprolinase subunit PxpB [Salibacterium qingdaonense]|uniref:5-oxoprolinase subunit PxpB n=1 Tax=Salibacterium qingdaonense TaxID=266892 RepID=UPI001FE018F1|nr:5-oxoprolinase subunit PxpB [Salibacterium qingdaonense]